MRKEILRNKNGDNLMKKYVGIALVMVSLLTIGTATATIFQGSNLGAQQNLILRTLGGGCGGHGGCHNNTNMTELTGVLACNGTTFTIETTILNFGCYNYLNTTISPYNFDGDGTLETILNELLGMVGTSITVEGYMCCHQSRLMVIYINGIEYREGCGPIMLSSV